MATVRLGVDGGDLLDVRVLRTGIQTRAGFERDVLEIRPARNYRLRIPGRAVPSQGRQGHLVLLVEGQRAARGLVHALGHVHPLREFLRLAGLVVGDVSPVLAVLAPGVALVPLLDEVLLGRSRRIGWPPRRTSSSARGPSGPARRTPASARPGWRRRRGRHTRARCPPGRSSPCSRRARRPSCPRTSRSTSRPHPARP